MEAVLFLYSMFVTWWIISLTVGLSVFVVPVDLSHAVALLQIAYLVTLILPGISEKMLGKYICKLNIESEFNGILLHLMVWAGMIGYFGFWLYEPIAMVTKEKFHPFRDVILWAGKPTLAVLVAICAMLWLAWLRTRITKAVTP